MERGMSERRRTGTQKNKNSEAAFVGNPVLISVEKREDSRGKEKGDGVYKDQINIAWKPRSTEVERKHHLVIGKRALI